MSSLRFRDMKGNRGIESNCRHGQISNDVIVAITVRRVFVLKIKDRASFWQIQIDSEDRDGCGGKRIRGVISSFQG
jgi:hypothetical protein